MHYTPSGRPTLFLQHLIGVGYLGLLGQAQGPAEHHLQNLLLHRFWGSGTQVLHHRDSKGLCKNHTSLHVNRFYSCQLAYKRGSCYQIITLGETTLMSSFRKRNFATSVWNRFPQFFMHVSRSWGEQTHMLDKTRYETCSWSSYEQVIAIRPKSAKVGKYTF